MADPGALRRLRPALFALLAVAGAAQAETRATVLETDPPGAAVTLGRDEALYVRIAYVTDEPVRLWARPYLQGQEVPVRGNPSPLYTGSGHALGWFSFGPRAQADEVRIKVGKPGSRELVEVARHPLRITVLNEAAAPRVLAAWVEPLRAAAPASAAAAEGSDPLTYGVLLLVAAVVLGVPALLVWAVWKAARGDVRVQPGDYLPYAAAAIAGLAVCLAISLATGRKEAWDAPLYFSMGIPVMALAIFAISYLYPVRAWRWTLSMALGQSIAMLMAGNSLSLWPLAILAMLVVSAPQFAAGFAASRLARRRAA